MLWMLVSLLKLSKVVLFPGDRVMPFVLCLMLTRLYIGMDSVVLTIDWLLTFRVELIVPSQLVLSYNLSYIHQEKQWQLSYG